MDHNTRWNLHITALRDFSAANGHARVPAGYVTTLDPNGTPIGLGAWVSYIRMRRRKGVLSPERIAELEQISGWEWGPLRPGPKTDRRRNDEIVNLRRSERMSLQQIADRYNLSRQRVHQIVQASSPVEQPVT